MDNVVDRVFKVYFCTFLGALLWRIIALCSTSLVIQRVFLAFQRCVSLLCMGKSVVARSAGKTSGYSDCCEVLRLVSGAPFFDCSVSDAPSEDIVISLPPSSITMGSVIHERMWNGPPVCGSTFKY